jgi:hypothetical protein
MSSDLTTIQSALENLRESIATHEQSFLQNTLASRLKIGLHCLKAHAIFAMPQGGDRKSKSRVTLISQTYDSWLREEIPWLKKPVSYKYMTALRGLELDAQHNEQHVDAALEALRIHQIGQNLPAPSLKSLADAAVLDLPQPAASHGSGQSEFQFVLDGLRDYRLQSEHILSLKSQLQENPAMFKAACARAYSVLSELTGTQWAPSDMPDELASVDPDNLSL